MNEHSVDLTLHNTNTNGALVREQAGNTLKSEEPGESGHRTVGVYGGSAPVWTSGAREDGRRPSNRMIVELTLHNTITNGALVREQAGNTLKSEEPGESGHRSVGVCGGSAPATNTTGTGEIDQRSMSSIRRLVGPVGLEPTLART